MITVIGITGPIGAGKSTVARLISQQGIPVIDADIVARRMTEKGSPVLQALTEEFGKDILYQDGSLNRRQLAAVAFADDKSAKRLNEITHPVIIESIKNEISALEKAGKKAVAIEATLLFESGSDKLCNTVFAVIAPAEIRMNRIIQRDNADEKSIKLRMAAQQQDDYYVSKAQYTIFNDENDAELQKQVNTIIGNIFKG